MILTFNTFKLKLFDLIDFTGWNIKCYTTSDCKDIGIETFVTIELNSFWSVFYTLYNAIFKGWDFIQLSLIFNLFLIAMVFFPTQQKSDVFPHKCTRPTFVLVRQLSQSDVCTSPTFVQVRRLYQSNDRKSEVCTVRLL